LNQWFWLFPGGRFSLIFEAATNKAELILKQNHLKKVIVSRYMLAVAGGLLLALALPKAGVAGLAWVAPGLILFAAISNSFRQSFRIGYVAGLAYYLTSLYWLLHIPFPAGAVAGWLALGAFLALYPAVWTSLCWAIFPHRQARSVMAAEAPGELALPAGNQMLQAFLATPLPLRIAWAFACAVIWVALEMIVARLFTGFPWNLAGASQYKVLPLIQIASVTGVYGVSFLLVWFSVSLASASLNLVANPTRSKAWIGDLALPFTALIAVVAFGSAKIGQSKPPARTLKAVLVQPSIPQTLIWDTNQNAIRFEQLIALSKKGLIETPDARLLIWPEAAVPDLLRYNPAIHQAVTNLAITHGVWMIVGADDAALRPGTENEVDYFNSSFLITPRGDLAGEYRKRQLVVFGEYVPLERWLPFMKYLTPVGGSFTAGLRPAQFLIPELQAKTSVLICFEDVFPHLAREYVEPDTDFLLNLTNNGWFGESAAQWQHAANAVFRAVENRLPLVRCANNGLTCWVDAFGGMHEVYYQGSTDIYGPGFKTADVPLLSEGEARELTFYTRHGDVFGWACVAGAGLILLGAGLRKRGKFFEPEEKASKETMASAA
jgi:apolipoprotein N-acyltransferase